VLWTIEHHPEADVLEVPTLFNTPGPLQDDAAVARAAALWREQMARRGGDPRVIRNAAHFFSLCGDDPFETEVPIRRARELEPANRDWSRRLALLYAVAILRAAGWQGFPAVAGNPGFAVHARVELDSSTEAFLIWEAGRILEEFARNGKAPQLEDVPEYGHRLQLRARGTRLPAS
jgi:hypothetical protein